MNAFAEESKKYDFIVDAKMACPTTYEENKAVTDKIEYIKSTKAPKSSEPYLSAFAYIDGGNIDQPVKILYDNRQDFLEVRMQDSNFRSDFTSAAGRLRGRPYEIYMSTIPMTPSRKFGAILCPAPSILVPIEIDPIYVEDYG